MTRRQGLAQRPPGSAATASGICGSLPPGDLGAGISRRTTPTEHPHPGRRTRQRSRQERSAPNLAAVRGNQGPRTTTLHRRDRRGRPHGDPPSRPPIGRRRCNAFGVSSAARGGTAHRRGSVRAPQKMAASTSIASPSGQRGSARVGEVPGPAPPRLYLNGQRERFRVKQPINERPLAEAA